MKALINYFIKFPIAANLLMFALLILGAVAMLNIKSTFFPEVETRLIFVRLVYPGASPEEIEEGVVNKIEENLKGVTGVERIQSTSSENSGTVNIEVFQGYDTDVVLQDVKNAVDQISSFPAGLEPPVIYKLENLGNVISVAISGKTDLKTLKRYGRKMEDDLLLTDGISKVTVTGFPEEEIEVAFREQDLRAYGLTFDQATRAVRNANLEITGGTVKGREEELLVRAKNKSYYADGLRDIVVKQTEDGSVIRLHQVADIRDQWAIDDPSRSYLDQEPAVVIQVQNTLQEDMISIAGKVNTYINQFNTSQTDVKAAIISDESEVILQRISLLTENGIIGFVIVMLLLAMFLHWRVAFWVAIAIPISFAGMFIVANFLGISYNVISLFGMILVIDILVDDGIVIGENIYKIRGKGLHPEEAALEGTMKVLPPVFSAILTTIIAFSAFFFIDGTLGDFFSEMAIVVIFSLVFSLVEGALILPAHIAHSKALDADSKPNLVQQFFDRVMRFMQNRLYAPVLKFSMENKFLSVSVMVATLMITVGAIGGGIISSTFFPVIELDQFAVTLQMPAGTSAQVTEKWLDHIEEAALRANESLSEQYFGGKQDVIEKLRRDLGPSTYEGKVTIYLPDGDTRDSLSLREVINVVREETGTINQAELLTFGTVTPFGQAFEIALKGENPEELSIAAQKVRTELSNLEELADVRDDNQEGLREINIALKEKALFLGLNLQEIVGQVRQGFFGSEVQRLQRGRDEVKVWVRYDEQDRSDITHLEQMRVRFDDGREFPLSEIAELNISRGVISINHLDNKRTIRIKADVANNEVSVSDVSANLRDVVIPAILANYPSVSVSLEGQYREQSKSAGSMSLIMTVVLGLMFLVIALTFRSIGQTLAVFLLVPFSLIGVAWGHYLFGLPISLFSILGFIALIGVLVNDALVLVATYNDLIREGQPQMQALYEAGVSRFRPILLTSVTTFAGLAPLLFDGSIQAQFLIPMAISVAFGLLSVTVIILILLPVLLIVVNRFKVYASLAWNGTRPSYESVEPAGAGNGGYQYVWYLMFGAIATMGVVFLIFGA